MRHVVLKEAVLAQFLLVRIVCQPVVGFQPDSQWWVFPSRHIHSSTTAQFSGSEDHSKGDITTYDVETALVKLSWETLEEANSRPVLDLSSRDASLEYTAKESEQNTSEWEHGQLWEETQKGLQGLGCASPGNFVTRCPQLLRLQPGMVQETAEWVISEFGTKYLESEPRFLCYRPEHVRYGLEFMSMMMMTDAKVACMAAPALLLSGIEGGIQEQAVKSALGAAGAATSKASQTIALDAMTAVKLSRNVHKENHDRQLRS